MLHLHSDDNLCLTRGRGSKFGRCHPERDAARVEDLHFSGQSLSYGGCLDLCDPLHQHQESLLRDCASFFSLAHFALYTCLIQCSLLSSSP